MTPEEKLCSRSWRLLNSAGLLWSILSLGFLTGVGFLIRGVKAKNRSWIVLGIGFLVLGIGLMVTVGMFDSGTKEAPITSVASTIWGWTWFGTFVGGITAAFITNRKWLLWKAHASEKKWYAQAGASSPAPNTPPATGYDPNAAAAALRSPAPATEYKLPAEVPTVGTLDINSASLQDLQSVLGFDAATASRIINARQSQGPFTSFEQLMAKGQVQPHILIPHRQRLVFGERKSDDSQRRQSTANQSARRLDL
jgi:DNA uptake protein ComE-like DNA-binding protein